jgi:hypothetical protein
VLIDNMTVTIKQVNTTGLPTCVEFAFSPPPDDPEYQFLVWRDGELQHFELPPVGQDVFLELARSPFHPRELLHRYCRL